MPIPLYSIKDIYVSKDGDNKLTIKQFDIHRGACYVFEGQMGSGKTTFLDILYNRRKVKGVQIQFEDKNIYKYSNDSLNSHLEIYPKGYIKYQLNTDEKNTLKFVKLILSRINLPESYKKLSNFTTKNKKE